MTYKIDPVVLQKVVDEAVGLGLTGDALITRTVELVAAAYPHLVDPVPGRWVGNKAGGILGKVRFLYFTPREYLVIFGTPTGTQGFSGRYRWVDVDKFLLAGQIDSYDVESDDVDHLTLLPGDRGRMERGHARGLTIHPGSFHLEYGRGFVAQTLPFTMMDTLVVSLEFASVRRSAVEFAALLRKQLRRQRRPLEPTA